MSAAAAPAAPPSPPPGRALVVLFGWDGCDVSALASAPAAGHAALDWLLVPAPGVAVPAGPPPPGVRWFPTAPGQGHGGDQKLAYRFALDAGYALVVTLCGAADKALAAAVVACWQATDADIVLVPPPHDAARWRNAALRTFSGGAAADLPVRCRGLAARFLAAVPFEINQQEEAFDIELLLQAQHAGVRVVWLPAPAATPAANGAPPAALAAPLPSLWRVAVSAAQATLHRAGMCCSLRYRHLAPVTYGDKTAMLYNSHVMALGEVRRRQPRRLLDLGCGPGYIARRCQEFGVAVTGVDRQPPAPGMMAAFHPADLDREPLPVDPATFDCVLLLDVIEHLRDPERFLLGLRHQAAERRDGDAPLLLLSTPNVAFWTIRLGLLAGRFNYADRGILDVTHTRLFTRGSLRQLLHDCGYAVEWVRPVPPPFETVMPGRLGRVLGWGSNLLARALPTWFAFQFLVACRPLPGARQLLRGAHAPR